MPFLSLRPCVLAAAVIVVVVAPFVLRRQSSPYGGESSPYPTEIDIDGGRDTDEDRDTKIQAPQRCSYRYMLRITYVHIQLQTYRRERE